MSRHELIFDLVQVSESSKRTVSRRISSPEKSNASTTSRVLKRYLTSGTNEGSSSEYASESGSTIMAGAIDHFKRKQKIQSVMYEDSSFILKKLVSHANRKSRFRSPSEKMSGNSLTKFLIPNTSTIKDTSSVSSSSPSTISRVLDRANEKNRLFTNDNFLPTGQAAPPIYEEIVEEDKST